MDVKKAEKRAEPGYPSRRQFAESAKFLGIAVIGLGTVLAAGCDSKKQPVVPVPTGGGTAVEQARLRGEVAVEPKPELPSRTGGIVAEEPKPAPTPESPARLAGDVMVEPKRVPSGEPTAVPVPAPIPAPPQIRAKIAVEPMPEAPPQRPGIDFPRPNELPGIPPAVPTPPPPGLSG